MCRHHRDRFPLKGSNHSLAIIIEAYLFYGLRTFEYQKLRYWVSMVVTPRGGGAVHQQPGDKLYVFYVHGSCQTREHLHDDAATLIAAP
eukprot:scaffold173826_cov62-Attheya_sp.AAC.8